jgi:hypothetical protein
MYFKMYFVPEKVDEPSFKSTEWMRWYHLVLSREASLSTVTPKLEANGGRKEKDGPAVSGMSLRQIRDRAMMV